MDMKTAAGGLFGARLANARAQVLCRMLLLVSGVTAASALAAADQVTFMLDFVPQGRHAPFYVAQRHGHYAAENLTVKFVRGQGDLFAVQMVAAGQATVGSAMPATVIEAKQRGIAITSIMVYQQRSPLSYAVWKDSGIASPRDFRGRAYGGNPHGAANRMFVAFLRANGVDPGSVAMKTVDPSALVATFLRGEFDIAPAFHDATWPIYQAEGAKLGRQPREFLMSDWGFNLLGYSVFARDSDIAAKRDLLRSFLRATAKGYHDLLKNPDSGVAAIIAAEPALNASYLGTQVRNALELMKAERFGYASESAMTSTLEIVSRAYGLSGMATGDVFRNDLVP